MEIFFSTMDSPNLINSMDFARINGFARHFHIYSANIQLLGKIKTYSTFIVGPYNFHTMNFQFFPND